MSCTSQQWKQAKLVTWSFDISTFSVERCQRIGAAFVSLPRFSYKCCEFLPLYSKTTYPWDVPLSRLQSIGLRVWNENTFTLLLLNHMQYTFQSWSKSGDQFVKIWGFNAALNSLSTVPATDGFALQLLDQMVDKQVRSIAPSSVFERSVGHKLTKDWDFS